MSTQGMVERVARALCFKHCSQGEFVDLENGCVGTCKDVGACDYWKTGFAEDARAAIEAMREPTDAMKKAACAAMSPGKRPTPKYVSCKEKHAIRYRAMICASLQQKGGE